MVISYMGNKADTCIIGVNKIRKRKRYLKIDKDRFQLILLFLSIFLFLILPCITYFSPVNWRDIMGILDKRKGA